MLPEPLRRLPLCLPPYPFSTCLLIWQAAGEIFFISAQLAHGKRLSMEPVFSILRIEQDLPL
jgi:hypothetical protein